MTTTATKATHTPTPWTHDAESDWPSEDFVLIEIRAGNKRITELGGSNDADEEEPCSNVETTRANAAFIVRAVNSHDELLAACKSLMDKLSIRRDPTMTIEDDSALAIAHAAILKAEAQQ
jgi:hypothetical protein